ncbi:MAG: biopolymer transporter ExbD [Pedobacter sp.]|nr:MAG: biopolymer transporter ExbD [Pedobacter sp.]
MAELSISSNRKAVPKVDLTAMVDLAFLLITFFMLTTSLSKPIAMDIAKPDVTEGAWTELPASRTMTILLGANNQVAWYMGVAGGNEPKLTTYKQIRASILGNKADVAKANADNPKKSLVIVVKPTSGSKYHNFVDIMDEISLANLTLAPAIDDDRLTLEETNFLLKHKMIE